MEAQSAHLDALLFAEFSLFVPRNKTQLQSLCGDAAVQSILNHFKGILDNSTVQLVMVNYCDMDNSAVVADPEIYNTNFVISKAGVVAKYRKSHVWFTKLYSQPATPDLVTFDAFGTTFGMFMCYDILFSSPGPALRKLGITRFFYNAAIPIVGHLAFEFWSRDHNATLIAAGGGSQVGVFLNNGHRAGTLYKHIVVVNGLN